MQQERRLHPRYTLNSLKEHITINRSFGDNIEIDGQIIDISYTGIKISLDSPLPETSEGHLKIVIILPESQIPLTIHGVIKHIGSDLDYGMQYIDNSSEAKLDLLMFECVKYSNNHNNDDYLKFI